MPEFSELHACVQRLDYEGFLIAYFKTIKEGTPLYIPQSTTLDHAREEWVEVLQSMKIPFTEDLLVRLTSHWLQVLTKQGAQFHGRFVDDILNLLLRRPTKIVQDPVRQKEIQQQKINSLDALALNISNDYQEDAKARSAVLPRQAEREAVIAQAVKSQDIPRFLVAYLSICRQGVKPRVPLTTVLDVIVFRWTDILQKEFGISGDGDFIKQLSQKWFYWMNLRGIPTSLDDYESLLIQLLREIPQSPKSSVSSKSTDKKKGFWSWLGA